MLFSHIKNDTKWEILDKDHIDRLLKDKDYAIIEKEEKEEIKSPNEDLNILSYAEIKRLAKEKGLKYNNVKKEELIKSLKEGE
ncbi:MAG TPA: hypothetical protein VIK26_05860 [Clostridium sp.]